MTTYFGFAIADSMFPEDCVITRSSVETKTAQAILAEPTVPCVNPSHKATIDAAAVRFGIKIEIPEVPPQIKLSEGDSIVVMGVRGLPRLTDRHEYTKEEIDRAEFNFALYVVEQRL